MAATQQRPAANGNKSHGLAINSSALNKIVNVPLVHVPLNFAVSTIEAHPLIARPYHIGEDLVNHSIKFAEPITNTFNGQLHYIDNQFVKALDFAESKWSYPFKATPQEVASLPFNVIAAYATALQKAWDSRVQPQVDTASAKLEELKNQNPVVQRAADAIQQLQDNLNKTIHNIKSNANKAEGEHAAAQAQGLVNAFLAELERVRGFAATLPADARKRFDPVVDQVNTTYHFLNKEVREGSGPLVPRLQKVLTHVQREAIPGLQQAILHPESSSPNGTNGSSSGAAPSSGSK
ncbi:unnamed protein product [Jaminaea pallidilutea]